MKLKIISVTIHLKSEFKQLVSYFVQMAKFLIVSYAMSLLGTLFQDTRLIPLCPVYFCVQVK